jgi:hypothetical protein
MRNSAAISADRRLDAHIENSISTFQTRADSVFNRVGLGSAPRRRHGDGPLTHRASVVNELLGAVAHLPALRESWKGFDAEDLVRAGSVTAFDATAEMIFADAIAATEACGPGSGAERAVTVKDQTGREMTKFFGDFDWLAPFKPRTQTFVTEWSNDAGRGCNSATARAAEPVGFVYGDGSTRAA